MIITAKLSMAQLKPVDAQSKISFKIKNLGFEVPGTFGGLQGSIRFDPAKPADALFDITVDASTVNTDNSLRDEHLRGENYFDVKKYPLIHYVSVSVVPGKRKNNWEINGKLTIKSFTKDVVIPFYFEPATGGGYVFTGNFSINRKDFNVGGSSPISDNLDLHLQVTAR